MRAMVSLVRSWLVGIGVFAAMTLSLCVALTFAIAGPPTKSELADLRALIADTLRSLAPAEQNDAEQRPVEHAQPAPAPEPPRRERSPLLGGPQTAAPAPEPQQAAPRRRQPDQTPAAQPPPAIDSRAAQIARDAEALLATLPPPPDKDAAGETEASAPADAWGDLGKEEWAETSAPFGDEDPDEALGDAWEREAP